MHCPDLGFEAPNERGLTSLNTLALANTKIDKKFERLTPVSKEEFNEVSG